MEVASSPKETRKERAAARQRSKEIDKQLQKDAKKYKKERGEIIMFLGSSNSGKSTLLKQLQILNSDGFKKQERLDYISKIHQNIFDSLKALLNASTRLNIPITKENMANYTQMEKFVNKSSATTAMPTDLISAAQLLWNDPGIQKCFERGNEFHLQDTAGYFLQDIKRFYDAGYVPTNSDIVRCRVATSKISETPIMIKETKYKVIDVGGQRSLRAFWLSYFDKGIRGIIFISSIASYDQKLHIQEDEGETNTLRDSVQLFTSICNYESLKNSAMILFLNKTDIFEEKLAKSPFTRYFPEFKGKERNHLEVMDFIKQMFKKREDSDKNIYIHFTNITDTKLISVLIDSVYEVVTKNNIRAFELS